MENKYYKYSSRNGVRPRSIVEGQLNLSSNEHKLFDMILTQINRDDDIAENTFYRICPKDYEKNVTSITCSKDFYKMLRNAGAGLKKKDMVLGGEKKGVIFSLVSEFSWQEDDGILEIELSKSAKKLLAAMIKDEPDTYYMVRYSMRLNGKYSHDIYYMLKEFEKNGWRKDLVVDLREKLSIPESYSYFKFKKCVILEAVKQINEKTDIEVSFKEIPEERSGKGRKAIRRIDWTIKKKNDKTVTDAVEEVWVDVLMEFIKGRAQIEREQALIIVRKAQENNLSQLQMKNRVNVILSNQNIKNFVGYCIWAMGSEFRSPSQVKHAFNNYKQRDYDYEELERMLLNQSRSSAESENN